MVSSLPLFCPPARLGTKQNDGNLAAFEVYSNGGLGGSLGVRHVISGLGY